LDVAGAHFSLGFGFFGYPNKLDFGYLGAQIELGLDWCVRGPNWIGLGPELVGVQMKLNLGQVGVESIFGPWSWALTWSKAQVFSFSIFLSLLSLLNSTRSPPFLFFLFFFFLCRLFLPSSINLFSSLLWLFFSISSSFQFLLLAVTFFILLFLFIFWTLSFCLLEQPAAASFFSSRSSLLL
jgi:hypothetical protein